MFGIYVSQFQFCRLVRKGEDGPCGATLMKNPMMPLCCVSFSLCIAMQYVDFMDVILSRMTSRECHFSQFVESRLCSHAVICPKITA